MKEKIKIGIKIILLAILLAGSGWLLGEDQQVFLRWWVCVLGLGIGFLPLAGSLFSRFADRGWLISKVLGISITGFLVWLFTCCHITKFNASTCLIFVILCGAANWLVWIWKKRETELPLVQICSAALDGEFMFTLFFLLWTYMAGFHPAAYGTEKFMDYGFMMTMMRSETLPAKDMWYAGENLNYYYGGQYVAVFLTKLTRTQVAQTYNLMRTLVAGFGFSLPFVLVRQMIWDYQKSSKKKSTAAASLAGLLAGAGVSLAGNMHYVIVGKILPWFREIFHLPEGDYTYWFPNSTRYIGYYPAENDKTIHEFPSYSFVLGDLHAHVVNVMFVLALICLIYAMIQKYQEKTVKTILWEPHVLMFAFFIGLFHWTNYWDFIIYFVMGGFGVIYCNYLNSSCCESQKERILNTVKRSAIHAVWVFGLSSICALPFTLQFESMVSGIALAQNHSRPYQWWMIWGLPVLVTVLFFICLWKDEKGEEKLPAVTDWFGIILGVSALGLICIPELVYVRDIYEKEYARSNTMFKLTYQAFIMFGILMGYVFVRIWMEQKKYMRKAVLTVGFVCFLGTCGYIGTAAVSWFGEIWDRSEYEGLDATAFLETKFSADASAIRWLNENIKGSPVVLEAPGDSYSDYERVSAMTGLPTIAGWYVHEWLWRDGVEDLNYRLTVVENIYTSEDVNMVKNLLQDYEVEYIFVGQKEREKYLEINEAMLQSLGTVVYRDDAENTYLVKVGNAS